ncbi:RNA methyltransferase, TrmH family, group 1 [Ancylobacter novellus DSM 506]|uniref:tRNA (cytidine/uridine-2'-O-)-methyltransferase TrmJ n=1 Tax=Ancylobacter novellus (strain ATCC 8093 / DSM 506 / JCM 20403 / CCM 1077 / IAM 12100 / NBRC 12443 / NCIMB 10456) TaxID=639283 RepID=D7A196_ANCN5|nr:RNA methyltransferase [Ancylobacter novellus]ADH89454.1 RNA methyltransferase, TrmH family, group 1 [Ancylobacter novellus DSM 506]
MPGAGTDSTRPWLEGGPVVVLVEPQLGENIGSAVRAMGNFGLSRLRLVNPREGWPNPKAVTFASGADRILENAEVFPDLRAALADLNFVAAATARERGMQKTVLGADAVATEAVARIAGGENVGLVFGRERTGLYTEEVSLADVILTLPVNPAFASLNLGMAVAVVAYEWFKLASGGALPFQQPDRYPIADKADLLAFFDHVEKELDEALFFRSPEKKPVTIRNIRNIFHRVGLTRQDIATLHGMVAALVEGRRTREERTAARLSGKPKEKPVDEAAGDGEG